jgi:hypothetical protein
MLDVGGIQAFEPEADPDETEVMMEHAQFEEYDPEKGVLAIPQPGFWQNHARHYDEHAILLKRDRSRFERWHPEAQRLFIEHLLATRQLVEAAAAALVPPVPAGGAGPSGANPGAAVHRRAGRRHGGTQHAPGRGRKATDQSLQPADFAAAGQ